MLSLRTATPDDKDLVADILKDSYPTGLASHYPPEILNAVLPLMCLAHPVLLSRGTYFIAMLDGEPAGCGGWSNAAPGGGGMEPGLAHIRHFAVRTGSMHRGVGRALYDRCAFEARTLGYDRIETEAALNAEGFYAALGFRALCQASEEVNGVAFAYIRMERDLQER